MKMDEDHICRVSVAHRRPPLPRDMPRCLSQTCTPPGAIIAVASLHRVSQLLNRLQAALFGIELQTRWIHSCHHGKCGAHQALYCARKREQRRVSRLDSGASWRTGALCISNLRNLDNLSKRSAGLRQLLLADGIRIGRIASWGPWRKQLGDRIHVLAKEASLVERHPCSSTLPVRALNGTEYDVFEGSQGKNRRDLLMSNPPQHCLINLVRTSALRTDAD